MLMNSDVTMISCLSFHYLLDYTTTQEMGLMTASSSSHLVYETTRGNFEEDREDYESASDSLTHTMTMMMPMTGGDESRGEHDFNQEYSIRLPSQETAEGGDVTSIRGGHHLHGGLDHHEESGQRISPRFPVSLLLHHDVHHKIQVIISLLLSSPVCV